MAGLQLSGLASGLDWKTLVDQLMEIERAPISRMEREQLTNTQRSNALRDLGTKLSSLQSAAGTLKDQTLFSGRTATSATTASTWKLSPSAGATAGTYAISVSQLATRARRDGAADITQGIATTSDVSGVTLATMRTAGTVTAGAFTVNGAKVTVATTDSLQSVFDAISTATGGDVTATYDAVTDRITLDSASDAEIVLGASNDTSNFLQVLKLANNTTGTVTSYGSLGSTRTGNTLANAGLKTAVTAVDGTGAGSFVINGVTIDYNVNNDSLSTLMKRINASGAGVTASYDAVNDRVSLANNATGDLGISISESAGGLLGALGLTSGHTSVRGENAEFSVDGGPTLISTSNTLDATAHGITGLSVTVDSETAQTITVAADTEKMRGKIDEFLTAYNAVITFIDEKTKVTSGKDSVSAAVLASNRDVQNWSRELRTLAFGAISGLTGTIDRLDDLGIDLNREGIMAVKDSEKLDAALANSSSDVEEFFTAATTGFAAKFDTRLEALIESGEGVQDRLGDSNSDLDRQIADLERRLVQQREVLTSSFIAMETAQSQIQQQSAALARAFGASSTSA
ncbi:flagellar hook protein [Oleiharenicola lentus]|jgi:flagellar hook-associated protein 2|uniref:Flagellar hook-associated protein 2 n=1 Tax=Oleiharenicola lentus TaxID=2508720 RepID=A0A4Q1C3T4_9BACT|nr:flagellar filament capping protein FliD [Oleiharenicola lentus]RXK53001.1 flagellar hook protein [Oleiharenicola lentus]